MDSKYGSKQKCVYLRVTFYRRRRRGIEISLGEPFLQPLSKPVKKPKNIARFALDVKTHLVANPDISYAEAAQYFKVSRARISQMIKIANNVPPALLRELMNSYDSAAFKKYSGKYLLKIASRDQLKEKLINYLP